MDFITSNVIILWFSLGALFIFLEAAAVPGIGFLFAGLSAITTGALVQFSILSNEQFSLQLASFLGTSLLWAAILWVPLQRFHKKNKAHGFSNIVGNTAIVYQNKLEKGNHGEVKWSGTVMSAMLSENSKVTEIAEGTVVKIEAVDGNILIVNKE